MQIGKPNGMNRTIGESQGYQGLHLRDRPVYDNAGGTMVMEMTSVWFPTPEELSLLMSGAGITLSIFGSLSYPAHPPIRLAVDPNERTRS